MKQVDNRGSLIASHEKADAYNHSLGYHVYNPVDPTSKQNNQSHEQYTFLWCSCAWVSAAHHQPSSPNSFVNLSCTSRSFLLTVGLCLERTFSKSVLEIGGGRICSQAINNTILIEERLLSLTLKWNSVFWYLLCKAFGCELLHGGLHSTRLFWSARHPHATICLKEEHGILCFAHRFK